MDETRLINILTNEFVNKEDDTYNDHDIDILGGQMTVNAALTTEDYTDVHGRRARHLDVDGFISYDDESEEEIDIRFEL